MKDIILGAAGFIGTNLTLSLSERGRKLRLFDMQSNKIIDNIVDNNQVCFQNGKFSEDYDFDNLLKDAGTVYHLISTTVPSSDISVEEEIRQNVIPTIKLLDACVKNNVKKIVFISSGGTVYGKSKGHPFKENDETNPICSYGVQKLTIEKYIQLYHNLYNLDYRIVRLSNPYGPGQNPKGNLGAVTKFTYNIINGESISIFGDGRAVRDYIYIDDAIKGIMNIADYNGKEKLFNLGNGVGYSLKAIVDSIERVSGMKADVNYLSGRKVDVSYSVLDVSKYKTNFKSEELINLTKGIGYLIEYLKKTY